MLPFFGESNILGCIKAKSIKKPKKLKKKVKTVKKAVKKSKKKSKITAKNAVEAQNAGSDFQDIETIKFKVPVIFAGTLTYKPGELGTASELGRNGASVNYTIDAIKDPKFIETVKAAAVSVGTHEKNTGEYNRDVDGWPTNVYYDDSMKAVIAEGYIHGAENVKYVKENRLQPGFGVSAKIKFVKVKREKGVDHTGSEFDAVATELVCDHIAILPNIRDRKNVILALNALNEEKTPGEVDTVNANHGKYKVWLSRGKTSRNYELVEQTDDLESAKKSLQEENYMSGKTGYIDEGNKTIFSIKNSNEEKKMPDIDSKALKNTIEELKKEEAANEEYEQLKNTVKEMQEKMNAKNADDEKKETEKKEVENANNALPSQEMIKDFSQALGVTFKETPTINQLAQAVGIDTKGGLASTIQALNAKRKEFTAEMATATNSEKKGEGFAGFLNNF